LQNAIGKNRIESITYAHLFEEALGVLEISLENNAFLRLPILNFVDVVAMAPENLPIAELIVSGFDKVILLIHIAYST